MYDPTCPNCEDYQEIVTKLEQKTTRLLDRIAEMEADPQDDTPSKVDISVYSSNLPVHSEIQQLTYQNSLMQKNLDKYKKENSSLMMHIVQLESANDQVSVQTLEKEILRLKKELSEKDRHVNQLNSSLEAEKKKNPEKKSEFPIVSVRQVVEENESFKEKLDFYRVKYKKFKYKYKELEKNFNSLVGYFKQDYQPVEKMTEEQASEQSEEEEVIFEDEPFVEPVVEPQLGKKKEPKEESSYFVKVMKEKLAKITERKVKPQEVKLENYQRPLRATRSSSIKENLKDKLKDLFTLESFDESAVLECWDASGKSTFELFSEFVNFIENNAVTYDYSLFWVPTVLSSNRITDKYDFWREFVIQHSLFVSYKGKMLVKNANNLSECLVNYKDSVPANIYIFALMAEVAKLSQEFAIVTVEILMRFVGKQQINKRIFVLIREALSKWNLSSDTFETFYENKRNDTSYSSFRRYCHFATFMGWKIICDFLSEGKGIKINLGVSLNQLVSNFAVREDERILAKWELYEACQVFNLGQLLGVLDHNASQVMLELWSMFSEPSLDNGQRAFIVFIMGILLSFYKSKTDLPFVVQLFGWLRYFLNPEVENKDRITSTEKGFVICALVDWIELDPLLLPLLVINYEEVAKKEAWIFGQDVKSKIKALSENK